MGASESRAEGSSERRPDQQPRGPRLLRGTGIVSSLTLVSRILGFFRDLVIARLFGASPMADAFFVAFRIPNLLRSFVAEGALTSAFVPVFSSELAKGRSAANLALRSTSALLYSATFGLSILGIIFAPEVVMAIAPGFTRNSAHFDLCVLLTRIMLPFICCVSLVAMINGALNAVHIYGAGAMAQVWMNVALIAGALAAGLFAPEEAVMVLGFSVLVGGVIQVLTQIPALRRAELSAAPGLPIFTPATRQILRLMAPAVIGATVYQLSIFLNTIFASVLEVGSVSWLFYADRLVQFPIGVFSIALASVLLPALSTAANSSDRSEFSTHLINSLRFTSFIMLPLAAGLYYFAHPITSLLFERGAFGARATLETARAVSAYSFGLLAVSWHSMLVRSFIARKDTVTPTLLGVFSLGCNAVFSLLLMGAPHPEVAATVPVLASAQRLLTETIGTSASLGHAGLALASSIASWITLTVTVVLVRAREHIAWLPLVTGFLKTMLAAAGAVWPSYVLTEGLEAWLRVPAGIALSGSLYLLLAYLLRISELQETFALFRRIVGRRE